MKETGYHGLKTLSIVLCLVLIGYPVLADDTCVFSVTANYLSHNSKTSTFMAPVVPASTTTSGNKIYMVFIIPGEGNFWGGNITKYGISSDNQIVDADGDPATWPNGAMKSDAAPYWATID